MADRSPFKFLDAYTLADRDIFFGRDAETERLYQMQYEGNLLLVYGPSGSGKTSLIQCGLASKFDKSDWFDITIRRRENINRSLERSLKKWARREVPDDAPLAKRVHSLFLDFFVPIVLIFDQFEEVYTLGTEEEREEFMENIKRLVEADLNCTVIIAIREEYLGKLYEFEKVIKTLFNHRMRVEPMSYGNVVEVIKGTAGYFNIGLNKEDTTIEKIIDNISSGQSGIQLSYLQIYLDKLYRERSE